MSKLVTLITLGNLTLLSQISLGITPEIDGEITFRGSSTKQGQNSCDANGCTVINNYCDSANTVIDPNDDGTIDLFFTDVEARSFGGDEQTICDISIPIRIPEGMRLNFKSLELEGTTSVGRSGRSTVKLQHKMGHRASPWNERSYWSQPMTQDVLIQSNYPGEFTRCGEEETIDLVGRIELYASGPDTSINIDGGAVGARYVIDYQPCFENPWIGRKFDSWYKAGNGQWVQNTVEISQHSGEYKTKSGASGVLFDLNFKDGNSTVEGQWRFQNGREGWFKFQFKTSAQTDYQGWWGYKGSSKIEGPWRGAAL